jgi:eukaryotic-like serine/threonine-protein kinase
MTLDTTVPPQLGNYDILSKIAEGGMGTVYKARNRNTGEIVAVKVIAPATAKNPVLLQRFEQEFRAAKVLDHPNVVKAIDYCGALPHPFLVMEFVDGLSIGQRIEQRGAYPEAEAIRLIGQVCDGLQRAHKQGLVHRDVKPDNILVTRDGIAKLTDLGLVKEVEGDLNLTRTGRGLGTPHYMAPEQFRNAKTVDVRGDIYSLGATLYAMVTGVIPFDNASPLDCWMKKIRNEFPAPKELNPALSERVDWAIRRAMSAEPNQRPSSCREFIEDLTGQSRAAAAMPGQPAAPAPAQPVVDVWYLVYRDENNQPHTVKGSTDGIRKALRDRLLGDPSGIVVSRTKNGNFVPLSSTPEFRDLVVTPTPMPLPGPRTASAPNPASPDETSDYDAPAPASGVSNVPRNRSPQPASGRYAATPPAPPPVPQQTPARTTSSGSRPRPAAAPTPAADGDGTVQYSYDQPASSERNRRNRNRPEPKPFNWTPILLVVVAILSAVIGYLIFTR